MSSSLSPSPSTPGPVPTPGATETPPSPPTSTVTSSPLGRAVRGTLAFAATYLVLFGVLSYGGDVGVFLLLQAAGVVGGVVCFLGLLGLDETGKHTIRAGVWGAVATVALLAGLMALM